MSNKIQNEDVKSETELIADGGTKSQLINDTKIYVTANSINKTLDDAIIDGDIGAGGGGGGGGSSTTVLITPWESFTPTGSWTTNTTYSGYKRRVGDTIEVSGKIVLAGVPGGTSSLTIDIPDSLSIDVSKIITIGARAHLVGSATLRDDGTQNYHMAEIEYAGTATTVTVRYPNGDANGTVDFSSPFVFAVNDEVHFEFRVPIDGWSATQENLIAATEVVAPVLARKTSSQLLTTGVTTTIIFGDETHDDDGLYDHTTGIYTVPKDGYYEVSTHVRATGSAWNSGEQMQMVLLKNGSNDGELSLWVSETTHGNQNPTPQGTKTDYFLGGDTLAIGIFHNMGSDVTVNGSGTLSYLSIKRIDKDTILNIAPTGQAVMIGEWIDFEPSFVDIDTLTILSNQCYRRRVGDSLQIRGRVDFSGASADTDRIRLLIPNSLQIDYTKIADNTGSGTYDVGHGTLDSDIGLQCQVNPSGGLNNNAVLFGENTGSGSALGGISIQEAGANTPLYFNFTVPIKGWSATSEVELRASESVKPVKYRTSAGQSFTSGAVTVVDFGEVDYDDDGLVTTGGSWMYTVPKTGYYQVSAGIRFASASWTNDTIFLRLTNGGTAISDARVYTGAASTNEQSVDFTDVIYATQGDMLDMRLHQDSGASVALSAVARDNYISIVAINREPVLAFSTPTSCIISDHKASGTDGGTFTSGLDQIRNLNTIEGNTALATIVSDDFELQPGKYKITVHAPAMAVNWHQALLYDKTNTAEVAVGSSVYSNASDTVQNYSIVYAYIDITVATTYDVRHRCTNTRATDGLGAQSPVAFGRDSVFTQVFVDNFALY